jgi:hypothetical protein
MSAARSRNSMRNAFAAGCALAIALAAHTPLASLAQGTIARDPIEGKWWGESGFPTDRIAFGLEFKRDSSGSIRAYLFQPLLNFYGWMLPGVVRRTGSTYEVPEYKLKLTLQNDTLVGTYHSLDAPASLRRTKSFPTERPIPALPAGPGSRWRDRLVAAIYASAAISNGIAYVGTTG